MPHDPIAVGRVESLCINGKAVRKVVFYIDGPGGDRHTGFYRIVSGHDGEYIRTSALEKKKSQVFNWRSWTGLSREEIAEVEKKIDASIPPGILQENITFSGIPNFSRLAPTSRLVFPERSHDENRRQAILAVWEENGPCNGVGQPLEDHHQRPGLKTEFIRAAQHKRGVMGIVLSAGVVELGDEVRVYSPVE